MALVLDDIEKKISRQILYLYSVVSSSWKDIRRREAKKRERERENAKKEEDDEMDVSRKKTHACVQQHSSIRMIYGAQCVNEIDGR